MRDNYNRYEKQNRSYIKWRSDTAGGLLGWIQERWFEFRMGHGTYLGFLLSFTNFVLIVYSLFLEKIFSNLTLAQFCLAFGSLYVPASIVIGRFHIKKQIRYDTGMTFNVNPGLQAMMKEFKEIKDLLRELVSEEDKKKGPINHPYTHARAAFSQALVIK